MSKIIWIFLKKGFIKQYYFRSPFFVIDIFWQLHMYFRTHYFWNWCQSFDDSTLLLFKKYDNFLWLSWSLAKNLSIHFCVPPLETSQPILPWLPIQISTKPETDIGVIQQQSLDRILPFFDPLPSLGGQLLYPERTCTKKDIFLASSPPHLVYVGIECPSLPCDSSLVELTRFWDTLLKDGELSFEDGNGPSSRILSNSSTDVACEGTSGIVESRPPPKESSSVKLAWISCKKIICTCQLILCWKISFYD